MRLKSKYFSGIKVFVPDMLNDRNISFCERSYSWATMNAVGISKLFPLEYDIRFEYENTIRGMYFQEVPNNQAFLIRCITGSAYVIGVDINPRSKNYKRYFKYEINANSREQVFIPPNIAIGFYSLENQTVLTMKTDIPFMASKLRRFNCFDETIHITWPQNENEYMSMLDRKAPDYDELVTRYLAADEDGDCFNEEAEELHRFEAEEAEDADVDATEDMFDEDEDTAYIETNDASEDDDTASEEKEEVLVDDHIQVDHEEIQK